MNRPVDFGLHESILNGVEVMLGDEEVFQDEMYIEDSQIQMPNDQLKIDSRLQ